MTVSLSFYPFLNLAHYVIDVYNDHSTGMTIFVRWYDFTQLVWLISCCQIFEDGAAYRGRMKSMGRDVVKIHYRAELYPDIDICHNSNQRDGIIADNVKKLTEGSLFLQGPADVNVSSCLDQ